MCDQVGVGQRLARHPPPLLVCSELSDAWCWLRRYRNKKLLVGQRSKWPGSGNCRFCLSTSELEVCQQADCPWGGDYAVCAACREKSWQGGKCEGCCVQADVDAKAAAAAAAAATLFEARGPELVRAAVQPTACVERGWVMYLAKRILPADEGKHLKGLFGCGPTPMDVPVGAIVVDADTGEFICARVRAAMGGNLPALKKDLVGDAKPSAPCGAKGGPANVKEFVTGVGETLDGVSTLASLRLKVPGAGRNFWTLSGDYVSARDESIKSYSQWSSTPDAVFSQGESAIHRFAFSSVFFLH